jgi:hypothetical protein
VENYFNLFLGGSRLRKVKRQLFRFYGSSCSTNVGKGNNCKVRHKTLRDNLVLAVVACLFYKGNNGKVRHKTLRDD